MTEADPRPLRAAVEDGVLRLCLARPKANIIDRAMTAALTEEIRAARERSDLKAVLIEAEGPHFSFGASVEEHLPQHVGDMLRDFHALFRALAELSLPLLAAVRGHCLGGGLELAAFCHRVFASPDAKLGQPEIKLGVFAPMGSLWLPERIGRADAEHLCLTGAVLEAPDALAAGLVDEIVEDPGSGALAYSREHFGPLSAASLRHAVRAVRAEAYGRVFAALEVVERMYLEDLMATADASEGITAFLEKRAPEWETA